MHRVLQSVVRHLHGIEQPYRRRPRGVKADRLRFAFLARVQRSVRHRSWSVHVRGDAAAASPAAGMVRRARSAL